MLALTWGILLIFVVLSYWYYKKDFTGPLFLVCSSMLLCFTIVCMNYENWDMKKHGFYYLTTITFVLALVSFFFGTLLVRALMSYRNKPITDEIDPGIMERTKKNFPYRLFTVLSIILFLAYIFIKFRGLNLSSFSAFKTSLRAIYDEEKTYNFFTTQLFEILVAIAYICLHRVMITRFVHKEKNKKLVYVPIVFFLIYALITTDRNILIRFFLFGLLLFVSSYEWKKSVFVRNRKLIVKVGIIGIVFALIFWGFGRMKNYKSGFDRAIGIYAGSGIYAYNLWLEGFDNNYTNGQQSFSVVQNTLAAVGIGEESKVPHNSEYTEYKSPNGYTFATNIYSAFRPYYQDFGMAGVCIIPFLTGALFEFLYLMNKRDKFGFWWMFYTSHVYPVVYYPILEQFLKRFHFGLVYEIGWLVVFYYLVYAKDGLWRVKVSAQR
ncbi:MAG: oligosaccharide repeat unit polymerase [Clostridiales bacterium]|nr:oligosaccharide repeat unit polymerase [Clostridiales bacterium]